MPATPTVVAAGSFADGGSGKLIAGAGPSVGEWDLVLIGSETTVEHVVNDLGDLAVEVDATGSQGVYAFLDQAIGGEGDDIVIDTNGSFRTVYVWLRLPSSVTAVDVSNFTQASGSDETMPALSTGTLAGSGDELVVYAGAGQDFAGATPATFVPSAGYTTLAVPIIGVGGESDAHFIYVSYRNDAGPGAESPNVTWGGGGAQNVRKRYPLFVAFTTSGVSPSTVDLTPAVASWSAVAVDPDPQPVAVALTPASTAWSGVALDPHAQPVQVALTPAVATWTGVALDADPGVVTVALTPAVTTWSAIPVVRRFTPGTFVADGGAATGLTAGGSAETGLTAA